MLAFEIKVKTNNRLDALSQKMVMPLVEIAKTQAALIRDRVRMGLDPQGNPWTPKGRLKGTGRHRDRGVGHRDGRGLWWVSPSHPQPSGWYFEIPMSAKGMQGFKVYRSYQQYVNLGAGGDVRDWEVTGAFWASVAVRAISARRVSINARGSRVVDGKRIANRDIGWRAGKSEKFKVFTYSDPERAIAVAAVKSAIDKEMAKRAGIVEEVGKITGRANRANIRTSRLLGG